MLDDLMKAISNTSNIDAACQSFAADLLKVAAKHRGICHNPVSGSSFMRPEDSLAREIKIAVPRLRALLHFGRQGPWGEPLPLNYRERELLKSKAIPELTLWALFARSLEAHSFDCQIHPSFQAYAEGLMLSHRGRGLMAADPYLAIKYPSRKLKGLCLVSTIWSPLSH